MMTLRLTSFPAPGTLTGASARSNIGYLTTMRYWPLGTLAKTNSPLSSVATVPSNPPARPINETTACAIRPPLGSLTVPVSLEVSSLPLGSETLPDIRSLTSPSIVRVRPGTPPDTTPETPPTTPDEGPPGLTSFSALADDRAIVHHAGWGAKGWWAAGDHLIFASSCPVSLI